MEGCQDTANYDVMIAPPLSFSITTNNCEQSVSANATNGVGPDNYLWNNASTTSSLKNLFDGNYYVVVTDARGCQLKDTISINTSDYIINIPNTFTPNGDGINDSWIIRNIENFPDNDLILYNRWGDEVYRKNAFINNWNGKELIDGTFYYVLKINNCLEQDEVYSGYLTIIR